MSVFNQNLRLFLYATVFMSGIISIPPSSFIGYLHIAISGAAAIMFYVTLFRSRKCGHGRVSQWNFVMFPFVIDPCPTCGERTFPD